MTLTNLRLLKRPTGGSWAASAATTNTAASLATVSAAGLTGFSDFGVGAVAPAPTTTPISYCQNATAVALTPTGAGLLWYAASTGGSGTATVIPTTTTAAVTTYYAGQTTVDFEVATNGSAIATVKDITGRVVFSKNIATTEGVNQMTVDMSELANGLYILNISDKTSSVVKRIVKQ